LFRGIYRYIPFSDFFNGILFFIIFILFKPKIDFIHARSDYSASVCSYFKVFHKKPIIWDCRGNSVSEFENAFNPKNFFLKIIKSIYIFSLKLQIHHAKKNCDYAIFVSDELKNLIAHDFSKNKSFIIPSLPSRELFYFDENIRKKMRYYLSIENKTKVIIYSGSLVKYQNFPQYVDYINAISKKDDNILFLVITPYIEKAKLLLKPLTENQYRLLSARFEDMNKFYNCADFGILLREKNLINQVASPTKFGEYIMTGLPIIMNDGVPQARKLAKEFNNLIDWEISFHSEKLTPYTTDKRTEISIKAGNSISKESLLSYYIKLYSLI
jgi:glycosyltransferase involved in cell wall biosynthesis